MSKIAIIGGGWYGCHIARVLQSKGYSVTLFESNDDILKGISGNFGVRLHVGPHYPRSEKTRKNCRTGYDEFIKTYPNLVVEHAYSIYALGTLDANNEPPKIDLKTFRKVGKENQNSREIDPIKWGYSNLQSAFDIEEPSVLVGNLLREKFKTYLRNAGVTVICNFKVHQLVREGAKTLVYGDSSCGIFDYAVNTTGYQSLLPPLKSSLPFELSIIYQPCLALLYEDKLSKSMSLPPFSFIVMDGWFPCIMPYIENKEDREVTGSHYRKYIVTHGKFTIMGSYKTVEEARLCLEKIDEQFIVSQIQPKCEIEMQKFWPLFGAYMPNSTERRFKCVGWKGTVLTKIKTNKEFRSAVTFAREGIVYVIPGKVSNIFDAERETLSLINNNNVLRQGDYQYVKGGVLHDAIDEITEPIDSNIRNTCDLQTYSEITHSSIEQKRIKPNSFVEKSTYKFTSFFKPLSENSISSLPTSKPSFVAKTETGIYKITSKL